MKKRFNFISILYIFLFVSGSVYGVGEKTILLGGESTWKIAESRTGVTEAASLRPYPVLILSSATGASSAGYSAATGVLGKFDALAEFALDMSISFDEREPGLFRDSTGNYKLAVSRQIEAVDRLYSRAGTGAALFSGTGISLRDNNASALVIEPRRGGALFTAGNRIGDFTIEFWLYPVNMENGEQILSWVSSKPAGNDYIVQRIHCFASKNRLQWSFENFFASTGGASHINIELNGNSPVIPKTWSHHLVRFDASTGMIEYIVNDASESISYATSTGREGGEVFTPVVGNGGAFVIGERFMGLMDEFKIHSVCAGRSSVQKYNSSGGRVVTGAVDLGENSSGVIRIDVTGGRAGFKNRAGAINNEFRNNGRFRSGDDSEMHFFIRAANNPYLLKESSWLSFLPGQDISGSVRGRYVQLAVDFYPSADGETSPYLDEVRITYQPGEPPLPPANVTAVAVDGGVLLRWKQSPNIDTSGYLVYYSAVRGELFGEEAALGPSPIDAGKRNSLLIDGLKNGTLYYFRIASYAYWDDSAQYHAGEFSREVTARPLEGLLLRE